jgi:hypothetical protein
MKKITKVGLVLIGALIATAALAVGIAHAQSPEGRRRGPPPEAFTACKDKQAAEACEVVRGEHTMAGTCQATPDRGLACRPDHPPGPPAALEAACASKQEGDACQATLPEHTIDGRCQRSRHGTALVCRP